MPDQNPKAWDADGNPIYGWDADGNPMSKKPFDFIAESQKKLSQPKPSEWQGHLLKWRDNPSTVGQALKAGFLEGPPKVELTSMEDYPGAKDTGLAGRISRLSRYPVGAAASLYNKITGLLSPLNIAAAGASMAVPEAAPWIASAWSANALANAPGQIKEAFNTQGKTPFQNWENASDAALSILGPALPTAMMYKAAHAPAFTRAAPSMPAEARPNVAPLQQLAPPAPASRYGQTLPEGIAGLLPEKAGPGTPPNQGPVNVKGGVPATLGLRPEENTPSYGGLRPPARYTAITPTETVMNSILPNSVKGQNPSVMPPTELGPPASELIPPGKITRAASAVRTIDETMGKKPAPTPTRELLINYDDRPFERPTVETPKPIQQAAERSPDPDVRATAGAITAENEQGIRSGDTIQKVSEWKTMFTRRGIQLLRELSPEAADLIEKAQADAALLAAKWTKRIKEQIGFLNGTEQKLLQQALDGQLKPEQLPSHVKSSFDILSRMTAKDGEYVTAAQQAGLNLVKRSGDKTLFTGIKNYWRRKPTPEWLESRQSLVDEIMQDHAAENDPITRNQAETMIYNAMKYGEKIKGWQRMRQYKSDVPYRTDMNVLLEDAIEKADRIVQAKYFGAEDINDPTSPLTIAIERSKNPDAANKIVRRLLNREPGTNISDSQNLQKFTGAMSLLKLGKIAISNLAPSLVNAPAAFPLADNLRGIQQMFRDRSVISDFGELAGIEVAFLRNLTKDVGITNYLNKVYGFRASEVGPRKLTAWIARSTADHFFTQLKENPNVRGAERMKTQLRYLTLEDPERLLQQNRLTDQQLLRAGYRGQAMVHGMAGTGDVPIDWARAHGWAKLAFQFKKFSYNSTANMKDMVKMGGPATLGKMLFFGSLAGELLGDTKMGLVGAVSGPTGAMAGTYSEGPLEQIASRGENGPTGNFVIDREISNLSNAWVGGILLDLFTSASRDKGLVEFAAGPTAGTASSLGYHSLQTGKNLIKNGWNGGQSVRPVAKDLLTNLPLPAGFGQGVYEGLYPPR